MKSISTKEFAELIVELIQEEPYFTKEVLVPKIKTLATAFRLRLSTTNYNAIRSPSQVAKLIRGHEVMDSENSYWKEQLCNIVGKEKMEHYYEKLNEKRGVIKKELKDKEETRCYNCQELLTKDGLINELCTNCGEHQ
jgi:2-keto-3-deoxy-galactonokinase